MDKNFEPITIEEILQELRNMVYIAPIKDDALKKFNDCGLSREMIKSLLVNEYIDELQKLSGKRIYNELLYPKNEINSVNKVVDIDSLPLTDDIMRRNGFIGEGYLRFWVDDKKYIEYYPYEHRLTEYYEDVDEWDNHVVVKDIIFRCTCRTVGDLKKAFDLMNINKIIQL